jgi:hypothetical protein
MEIINQFLAFDGIPTVDTVSAIHRYLCLDINGILWPSDVFGGNWWQPDT